MISSCLLANCIILWIRPCIWEFKCCKARERNPETFFEWLRGILMVRDAGALPNVRDSRALDSIAWLLSTQKILQGAWLMLQDEFVRRAGHIVATDLMIWCANNEPPTPAPGKDDFHMETVCTLVNIIGNAARSSVKVRLFTTPIYDRSNILVHIFPENC